METIRFGSVCSGIEAASAAWLPLGWQCAFMSEIEAFPRAVLQHHYPETPLHGDFTTIQAGEYAPIDVLVGGTPCQSFSVAGLRGGIADSRGNLALEFIKLAQRLRPRYVVWENVPGVLSSLSHNAPDPCQPPDGLDVVNGTEWVGEDEYDADESHAFACFLAGLSAIGYGWAYRIFDAQYAGLAQRRERVFVVASPGDWRGPSEVLSLREGLRWHPAPSRAKGQGIAPTIESGVNRTGGTRPPGTTVDTCESLIANPLGSHKEGGWRGDLDNDTFVAEHAPASSKSNPYGDHESREGLLVARSLNAHAGGRYDGESETFVCGTLGAENSRHTGGLKSEADMLVAPSLRADGFDASEDGTGRGTPIIPLLEIGKGSTSRGQGSNGSGFGQDGDPMFTLQAGAQHGVAFQTSQSGVRDHETHATLDANNGSRRHNGAIVGSAVRRLTPRECERLQGFPDDYTLIPYRGKPAADGPRYRALGNSMAVPVMKWIGQRIAAQS